MKITAYAPKQTFSPSIKMLFNQSKIGKYMEFFNRIVFLAILLPAISYGEDELKLKHEDHENISGVEALSYDLRNFTF